MTSKNRGQPEVPEGSRSAVLRRTDRRRPCCRHRRQPRPHGRPSSAHLELDRGTGSASLRGRAGARRQRGRADSRRENTRIDTASAPGDRGAATARDRSSLACARASAGTSTTDTAPGAQGHPVTATITDPAALSTSHPQPDTSSHRGADPKRDRRAHAGSGSEADEAPEAPEAPEAQEDAKATGPRLSAGMRPDLYRQGEGRWVSGSRSGSTSACRAGSAAATYRSSSPSSLRTMLRAWAIAVVL